MEAVFALLLGEPWCLRLDDISRLTMRQIERLYLEPARKRAREMRGKKPRKVSNRESRVPDKETFVADGRAMFGGTEDHWAAEWDRLMGGGGATATES